jgi:hypothetical protein
MERSQLRTVDGTTLKFTASGSYLVALAYKAQFEGMIKSFMPEAVWINWAPPKCKLFPWLILQNRVWTADRLQKCGWPNCSVCQLCKRDPETVARLLFRYSFEDLELDLLFFFAGKKGALLLRGGYTAVLLQDLKNSIRSRA